MFGCPKRRNRKNLQHQRNGIHRKIFGKIGIDIFDHSVKIFFDKEKTQKNITHYNEPCDCQDCRNYYKNIESNKEVDLNMCGRDKHHIIPEHYYKYHN